MKISEKLSSKVIQTEKCFQQSESSWKVFILFKNISDKL